MECLSVFLFLILAVGLGGWLRAVSRRNRTFEARIAALESEIGALRRAFAEASARGVEAAPETVQAPQSAAPVVAAPAVAAPPPVAEASARPAPAKVVTPAPESVPPVEIPAPPVERPEPAFEPPGPAPRRVDWERWLGVRGAAVLGAAVLALAGFLFLKFSIEQGLIPPPVRVILGLLAGLASIVGSESLRRRAGEYRATADALAGAGVVLLYAAVWAARSLYDLIPAAFAFVLMALVTAACGALSWRYGSMVIAGLGLIGGFATPALLSTGEDRPIALFGYLLLLDAALLVLAAKRGWPGLAAVGLAFTALYQGFWIFSRMGSDRGWLGLGILGLFALVYAVAGRRGPAKAADGRSDQLLTQAGAVLLPFGFALYFAGRADLGGHLYPIAALLFLLSGLALGLSRAWNRPLPALAAAAADVAVVAVWSLRTAAGESDALRSSLYEGTPSLAWELAICVVVLALLFHLFRRLTIGPVEWSGSSLVAASGFLALLVLLPAGHREIPPEVDKWGMSFWPWLCGWLGLAAMLWRQADWPVGEGSSTAALRGERRMLAAIGLGLGFGFFFQAQGGIWPVLFSALAVAVVLQALALAARGGATSEADAAAPARRVDAAAAAMPLSVLILLFAAAAEQASVLFPVVALAFGGLVALAATRLRSGRLYFVAVATTAIVHGLWSFGAAGDLITASGSSAPAVQGLAIQALAVVLFTVWPFLAADALRAGPWAWRAAALAGPAWFLPMKRFFEGAFGDAAIGLLPVALGALSLAAAFRVRRLWPGEHAAARDRLAWFAAAALGFVGVAIPLQLEKEWITIGWALQGLAVTVLWRRLNHPGLKYFALALLAAASARLVANPALLGYYPRGGWPVFNWLLYTYLVPAAALAGTAVMLFRLEAARHRDWERQLFGDKPGGAVACALAAILVVFVWINLTIFDLFSTGERLAISFDRMAGRDLAMSLAWIAYALVLLGLGMALASRGLRWISLAFLILAIGKVFLYDLGELEDLYRVASLLGLAFSLILVSLAYQRFVFGKQSEDR